MVRPGIIHFHQLDLLHIKHQKTIILSLIVKKKNKDCSKINLENCNTCKFRPNTNFDFMNSQIKVYFNNLNVRYVSSNFSIKTIPNTSEVSDSRPTKIISQQKDGKMNYTVFSGKVNNIFDMDSFNFK